MASVQSKIGEAYWDDAWETKVDRSRVMDYGKNKTPIYAIPYQSLPRAAQQIVYNLSIHGPGGDSDWFFFTDRDGVTEFKNKGDDLPDSGPYREYTVLMGQILDSGKLRIVHDEKLNVFYFTPYHYQKKLQGEIHGVGKVLGPAAPPPDNANPFYMVVDIPPFKKKV